MTGRLDEPIKSNVGHHHDHPLTHQRRQMDQNKKQSALGDDKSI